MPKEVRWAAEQWMDIFMNTLGQLLIDDGAPEAIARKARLIADAALREIEERWPGVRV